ncbi:MAG: hypothetical protein ABIU05_17390 [Nitrospirales bacterium]
MKPPPRVWVFIVIIGLAIGIYLAETDTPFEMVEAMGYRWEPW